MTARVSVGVPVYNGERFLGATLDALRAQELGDLEIVVSDNGSTDGTEDIARAAAAEDDRVVYVREPQNRGMGWNFDRTLAVATAPLFMWNAADDVARPSYLRCCVDALDGRPDAVVACSRVGLIDEHGRRTGALRPIGGGVADRSASARLAAFLSAEGWDLVFGVIRTDVLRAVGGMPHLVGDDVMLGTDLLLRGRGAWIDDELFLRRRHADQSSEQQSAEAGTLEQRPDRTPWLALPQWRINAELYRRVAVAPLPWSERLACAGAVLTGWTLPRRRRLLGDVRRSAELVAGRLRG